jgi:hypothetical protein
MKKKIVSINLHAIKTNFYPEKNSLQFLSSHFSNFKYLPPTAMFHAQRKFSLCVGNFKSGKIQKLQNLKTCGFCDFCGFGLKKFPSSSYFPCFIIF